MQPAQHRQGHYHEADDISVRLHGPHPGNHCGAIHDLGEQGVGIGVGHRRHKTLLGLVGPQPVGLPGVVAVDLDECDTGRSGPGAVAPPLPIGSHHPIDPVVGDLASSQNDDLV